MCQKNPKSNLLEPVLAYIPYFDMRPSYQLVGGANGDGSFSIPYAEYIPEHAEFIREAYAANLMDKNYSATLQKYRLGEELEEMVPTANFECLCAILTTIHRCDHFDETTFAESAHDGTISAILQRFKELVELGEIPEPYQFPSIVSGMKK